MFFMQRHRPWPLAASTHEGDRLFSLWEEGERWAPAVDISEAADAYVLHADLPGMRLEDITLARENGVLTLSGERRAVSDEAKDGYRRVERRAGHFSRSFSLPEGTAEKITARYRDGVLEVRIPKQPQAVAEHIEIQH